MASQTSGITPSQTNQTRHQRGFGWWLARLALLVVLAGGAAFGWRQFREFRKGRMIARAKSMIEQKDYPQAMLSARRALQLNPRDVAVVRMMVELSESAKTKESLYWHRMLAELEPNVAANDIEWADCALRYNEAVIAGQALAHVRGEAKKSAQFHDAAGRLAQMGGQLAEAESHFVEAAKLEPGNPQFQVHLAAVRLQSENPDQQAEALAILQAHLADVKFRDYASHALLDEFLREKEWGRALRLARQVQEFPDATFGDRMIYLGLLRRFEQPEFGAYLLTLQDIAGTNPEDTASLISWLADNTLVMVAVSWAKTLPVAIVSEMPVPAALGECYAMLHDWDSLKKLVTDTNWKYLEFLRFAFLARVQREGGDLQNSRNSWNSAVRGAGEHADQLIMLTRHGTKWGWESEVLDLLWVVARGNIDQQAALNALYRNYITTGNTRGLLNVCTRMLEIDPKDTIALNNVVLLSLLLNSNVERAQALADEAYRLDPRNPGIISTYAFALHVRGHTEEGIKLMRALDDRQFSDPSVAAYFASMLVESPTPKEAKKFIEIALTGNLLPEEMALVKSAREALIRRSADKANVP